MQRMGLKIRSWAVALLLVWTCCHAAGDCNAAEQQQAHARSLHEATGALPQHSSSAARQHEHKYPHRQAWHYQPSTPHHILDRTRAYTGDDNRLKVGLS
jgi:hypothetical protein